MLAGVTPGSVDAGAAVRLISLFPLRFTLMKKIWFWLIAGFAVAPLSAAVSSDSAVASTAINPDVAAKIEAIPIATVWAGHPGGFSLLTHGSWQYVAFYDESRRMCVAQRKLGETKWSITKLPSSVGWDSHNYIRMALDRDGCLHVSGNMHVQPLVYFRSRVPFDASTLEKIPAMTGQRETRCTYPRFFNAPDGSLVFAYRDGMSGQGDTLYNLYGESTHTWRRLVDQPIFDGQNQMSSYPIGPDLGPDGFYHLTWVWRDTIHAETNHDLGYARSRDLVHWETVAGQPIQLPITLATPGVLVDPIPAKGGIINGSGIAGFDLNQRLVIAYHKFDAQGLTQLYFARFEAGAWKQYQASDWKYRWYFQGGGSIVAEIRHSSLHERGGKLVINIRHPDHGSADWEVDPQTLRLIRKIPSTTPPILTRFSPVESTYPGMEVRWASDSATEKTPGASYRLRWESLPNNRDQPRPEPWPQPALLRLIVVPANADADLSKAGDS